jgi:hypothetical protein
MRSRRHQIGVFPAVQYHLVAITVGDYEKRRVFREIVRRVRQINAGL